MTQSNLDDSLIGKEGKLHDIKKLNGMWFGINGPRN